MGHPDFRQGCRGLVEADEVGFAFRGLKAVGDLFGGAVRFSVGADADPVAGGAVKIDDVGAGIFAPQAIAKAIRLALTMEGADLDAPAALLRRRGRETQDVDADARGTGAKHADFDGGGAGQIQNAAGNERAAISNGDHNGLAGGEVGNAHDSAHGQGAMGGGHGVFIVDLAIGPAGVVVGRAVPTGHSNFTFEDAAVGSWSALGGGRRRRRRRGLLLWRRRRRGGLDGAMAAAGDDQAERQGRQGCEGRSGRFPFQHFHSPVYPSNQLPLAARASEGYSRANVVRKP